MPPATSLQAAGVLLLLFEKRCSVEEARAVVAETGYNDSPFFGAEKARVRLLGELSMMNSALTIIAVNRVFELPDAKTIVDYFLAAARESVFLPIERKDSTFRARYEQRMSEYFRAAAEEHPGQAISFSFVRNLGLDPLKSPQTQPRVALRLGQTLTANIVVLRTMELVPGTA